MGHNIKKKPTIITKLLKSNLTFLFLVLSPFLSPAATRFLSPYLRVWRGARVGREVRAVRGAHGVRGVHGAHGVRGAPGAVAALKGGRGRRAATTQPQPPCRHLHGIPVLSTFVLLLLACLGENYFYYYYVSNYFE